MRFLSRGFKNLQWYGMTWITPPHESNWNGRKRIHVHYIGRFLFEVVVAGIHRNREQEVNKLSRQSVLLNMLYQLQESVLRQIGGKCRISITATNTKLIDILIMFPH